MIGSLGWIVCELAAELHIAPSVLAAEDETTLVTLIEQSRRRAAAARKADRRGK